jgi:hypothetical protein
MMARRMDGSEPWLPLFRSKHDKAGCWLLHGQGSGRLTDCSESLKKNWAATPPGVATTLLHWNLLLHALDKIVHKCAQQISGCVCVCVGISLPGGVQEFLSL